MPRAIAYVLWLVGIVGLLALVSVSCDGRQAPQGSGAWDPRFPSEEERIALMAWEYIPNPPRPKVGRLVRTPAPPYYPLPLSLGMPAPGTEEHDVLHDRLDVLLNRHPDPRISKEFAGLLARDELALQEAWWDPRESSVAAAFFVDVDGRGAEKPTLLVNMWHVAAMKSRYDVLLGMLVMTHEYTHYTQWLEARGPYREYFQSSVEIPCQDHWEMERAAYLADCSASYTYGAADFNAGDWMCRRHTDDAAFDQALFIHMLGSGYVDRSPRCISDWAAAAGHPHPEAFLPGEPVVMQVYEQLAVRTPGLAGAPASAAVTGPWSTRH